MGDVRALAALWLGLALVATLLSPFRLMMPAVDLVRREAVGECAICR